MTDEEFLRQFETASLPTFGHVDHVRAAWVYLERHPPERALPSLIDAIEHFAATRGAPGKFHYTVTRAWLELIADARHRHPSARTAAALLAACPLLANPRALEQFYALHTLNSDAARAGWVEPDRAPLHTSIDRVPVPSSMPNVDPIAQFHASIERARSLDVDTAPIALATADARGRPSVRMVLMRGADERGFVFHTNYTSRKARELTENPYAALCLHWPSLEEQIRVEGTVARLPADESDGYFSSRPRGSQIGAWASEQSQVLPARSVLENRIREVEQRFAGQPVPRPPFWGGFRLTPERIEFWYGRADRLHDRVVYLRDNDAWRIERLFP